METSLPLFHVKQSAPAPPAVSLTYGLRLLTFPAMTKFDVTVVGGGHAGLRLVVPEPHRSRFYDLATVEHHLSLSQAGL